MTGRRRMLLVLAAVLVVGGGLVYRCTPLWPGPALPSGATRLQLVTGPPHLIPTIGCPGAALAPVTIEATDGRLTVWSHQGWVPRSPVAVVFPSGWAAWIRDGRVELVDREGHVVARDGDVLEGLGAGTGDDGAVHICIPGS